MESSPQHTPAHRPSEEKSDEATRKQLDLAMAQGDAYREALRYLTKKIVDDAGAVRAGDYRVACAVERAEGLYHWQGGRLVWEEPGDANVHVEIAVADAGDGRFVPGLHVTATLVDPDGRDLGTREQPFLWHPSVHHYGRNWRVPGPGAYTIRVRIDPPAYARHDKVNGKRFAEPVDVEFTGVQIEPGQD